MRKQYHFQPSENGFYAWDIDKLIEARKDLHIFEIDISTIKELDEDFWYNGENDIPIVSSIVDHMKLTHEVSLTYPIILSADHSLMDGIHRISKALFEGITKVRAVNFIKTPMPDYEDIFRMIYHY